MRFEEKLKAVWAVSLILSLILTFLGIYFGFAKGIGIIEWFIAILVGAGAYFVLITMLLVITKKL